MLTVTLLVKACFNHSSESIKRWDTHLISASDPRIAVSWLSSWNNTYGIQLIMLWLAEIYEYMEKKKKQMKLYTLDGMK